METSRGDAAGCDVEIPWSRGVDAIHAAQACPSAGDAAMSARAFDGADGLERCSFCGLSSAPGAGKNPAGVVMRVFGKAPEPPEVVLVARPSGVSRRSRRRRGPGRGSSVGGDDAAAETRIVSATPRPRPGLSANEPRRRRGRDAIRRRSCGRETVWEIRSSKTS